MATETGEERFFVRLALAFLVLTLLGFATTYFIPLASGKFTGPPILHLHGVAFLAWPCLFLTQALSANRSRRWHRGLGFFGISLATTMVILGLAAIPSSIESWQKRGIELEAQVISVIAFTGLVMFAGFVIAALFNIRNRQAHPRLMALATLSIMQAVSGRLFLTAMLGGNLELTRPGMLPPPPLAPTMVPHLVFDLVILVIMTLHDRRRLGKIHWATLLGGGVILMVHSTRHLFGHSAAWRVVAEWLVAI